LGWSIFSAFELCFFFALEAGKRNADVGKSFEIASEVVDCFRFLENDIKNEVIGIITTYYFHAN
jgi:hypothetical protein